MDLHWLDPHQPDQSDVAGAVAVLAAAREVDVPYRLPSLTAGWFTTRLRHGGDGEPPVVAVARDRAADPAGRVVGVLSLSLPGWDNTHLANVQVTVDPRLRRRGLGRQLFESGVARVRAEGRRLACSVTFDPGAGMSFLKAMGLDPVLQEVVRQQDLLAVDWSRLDQEFAAAWSRADGYELLRLPGPVPEELLPAVCRMTEAINDAPNDDLEFEDEVFPPERIRAYEEAQRAYRARLHRVVARHRDSGELAGHTVVAVDGDHPWYGWQHDTSVVRAHRGHRLGLLLKAEMLRWLREAEPQLRTVLTGNAGSNAHMIAVNETLGYEVVARTMEWQQHLNS